MIRFSHTDFLRGTLTNHPQKNPQTPQFFWLKRHFSLRKGQLFFTNTEKTTLATNNTAKAIAR